MQLWAPFRASPNCSIWRSFSGFAEVSWSVHIILTDFSGRSQRTLLYHYNNAQMLMINGVHDLRRGEQTCRLWFAILTRCDRLFDSPSYSRRLYNVHDASITPNDPRCCCFSSTRAIVSVSITAFAAMDDVRSISVGSSVHLSGTAFPT